MYLKQTGFSTLHPAGTYTTVKSGAPIPLIDQNKSPPSELHTNSHTLLIILSSESSNKLPTKTPPGNSDKFAEFTTYPSAITRLGNWVFEEMPERAEE